MISGALGTIVCNPHSESEETDDISDDGAGWESHRSLKALAELLEAKDLPHWTDESFRPEFVATSLYPLPVPPLDVEDET